MRYLDRFCEYGPLCPRKLCMYLIKVNQNCFHALFSYNCYVLKLIFVVRMYMACSVHLFECVVHGEASYVE